MTAIELFDTHNRLNFPTEAQVSAMLPAVQKRFEVVRTAKAKLDSATAHRVAVEQRIKDNSAEAVATKTEMDKLRPKWSEMDNIKAHIASEQAQRRRERGLG
jgi:uncharacterized protein YPO0396